jgi:hypothetical protein
MEDKMKRKTPHGPPGFDQERIKRMKEHLSELRREMVQTAPEKFQEMFTLWMDLGPDFQVHIWERDLIAKILENTDFIPTNNAYVKDRAPCPLCGEGPEQRSDGFAMPTGLERHLEGYGNQRQCRVMRAARDFLREKAFAKYPERYAYNVYWD